MDTLILIVNANALIEDIPIINRRYSALIKDTFTLIEDTHVLIEDIHVLIDDTLH